MCGLALGLAVAGLVYVKDHRPDAALVRAAKADKKKPRPDAFPETEGGDAGAAEDSPTSYAFYDMLPKFEVVVPEKEKDVRPDIRAVPETRRGTYVLQAGSYKNFADADRVRAQLALQGDRVQGAKGIGRQRHLASHPDRPDLETGRTQSPAHHPAQGRCRRPGDPGGRLRGRA